MTDERSIPAELVAVPEQVQETPSAQPSDTLPHEEHVAMLDIHDAHHAASTWREFFIHIGTIVLGLMIAVSLEQAVEYFHHQSERRQLEQDLRAEAEGRIALETLHLKSYAMLVDWDQEVLARGRAATASGGFVTFVLPDRPQILPKARPDDATWPAAKASGVVAVLPNEEVEAWGQVDFWAQMTDREGDDLNNAMKDFHAVASRLGVSIDPGATVRVTPEERDELMRALALYYVNMQKFMVQVAYWQGSSDAVVHGALTTDQIQPYINRALAALPR